MIKCLWPLSFQQHWTRVGEYRKSLACITLSSIRPTECEKNNNYASSMYSHLEMLTGHFGMKASTGEINVYESVTAL